MENEEIVASSEEISLPVHYLSPDKVTTYTILQNANVYSDEILAKFKDEDVNDLTLKNLQPRHVEQLFTKVGHQANFQAELTKWRQNPRSYLSGDIEESNSFPEASLAADENENELEDFHSDLFDLMHILKKYSESKRVLINYHRYCLEHKMHRTLLPFERKAIIGSIVRSLKSNVENLRSSDFLKIIDCIIKIFPCEISGTYFIPPHSYDVVNEESEKGKDASANKNAKKTIKRQVVARGALVVAWRYQSQKKKAEQKALDEAAQAAIDRQNAGVVAKKLKLSPEEKENLEPSALEKLLRIKSELAEKFEPMDDLLAWWEQTCSLRAKDIQAKDFNQLISEWPRYHKAKGFKFIEIDFKYGYPNKEGFKTLWPKHCKAIIKLGLATANKNKEKNKDIIKKLERFEGLSDCEGNLAAFSALHSIFFLLPNKNKTTKQNIKKMLHRAEKGQKVDDIIAELAASQKKDKKFHPLITYYENEDCLPYKFYTCVNDIKYEFEHLTTSIDILIKSFFVFDLAYPEECRNVLSFLQHFYFDIFLPKDFISADSINLMVGIDPQRASVCNQKISNKVFDKRCI